jgi:hypothetical protein
MSLLVPNDGEEIALKLLVNKASPENLVLRLYTNDKTPAETDVASDYTEASGSGYSAITLTGANWTVTPGAPTLASHAQQTFTITGALGNVYGYFLTQATSGKLVWAERFSAGPYNLQNGDLLKVTPKLECD